MKCPHLQIRQISSNNPQGWERVQTHFSFGIKGLHLQKKTNFFQIPPPAGMIRDILNLTFFLVLYEMQVL